jgi:hypothetical protein
MKKIDATAAVAAFVFVAAGTFAFWTMSRHVDSSTPPTTLQPPQPPDEYTIHAAGEPVDLGASASVQFKSYEQHPGFGEALVEVCHASTAPGRWMVMLFDGTEIAATPNASAHSPALKQDVPEGCDQGWLSFATSQRPFLLLDPQMILTWKVPKPATV